MRYVSLFSGIEAATVAWEPLGWEPVAFAEVDEFPSAVLAERFPEVPNLGDVTKIEWSEVIERYGAVDLVVGGSPCQSFSVAGNRTGLEGASGLMWEYVRALRDIRPRWAVWENVPGCLSSGPDGQSGEDFGCLLRSLDDLGYGLCWRVLDAQFFGVAQRRRRVFLVGCLGAEPPVEVLFEPDGLRWDYNPSREEREILARAAGVDLGADRGAVTLKTHHIEQNGRNHEVDVSPTLDVAGAPHAVCIQGSMIGRSDGNGPQGSGLNDELSFTLNTADRHAVCFQHGQNVVCMTDTQAHSSADGETCGTLSAHSMKDPPVVCDDYIVRRLTPRECERLQGFPDDWTRIPYRGKPAEECPDGPRYKALGNSMAVPVMRWIGERIAKCEEGE